MRVRPDPAIGRIRRRPDFLAAARGRKFHSPRMSVQALERGEAEPGLRFGFTITKKVGNAVVRNRIRRRLRAAAVEAGESFAQRPLDAVIIGRRDALAAPFPVLVGDLARALAVVTAGEPGRAARPSKGQSSSGPHA